MSMTEDWRPKRPGPASDRDIVTNQTLRAGIRAPPPEKPYLRIGAWETAATAWPKLMNYVLNTTEHELIIKLRVLGTRQNMNT